MGSSVRCIGGGHPLWCRAVSGEGCGGCVNHFPLLVSNNVNDLCMSVEIDAIANCASGKTGEYEKSVKPLLACSPFGRRKPSSKQTELTLTPQVYLHSR